MADHPLKKMQETEEDKTEKVVFTPPQPVWQPYQQQEALPPPRVQWHPARRPEHKWG